MLGDGFRASVGRVLLLGAAVGTLHCGAEGAPSSKSSGPARTDARTAARASALFPTQSPQKLVASDRMQNDYFGHSVAMSADGNLALVGAQRVEHGGFVDNGAAYVFTRNGAFTQQAKLVQQDPETDALFGSDVALSADGSTALVGAYADDEGGLSGSGAVYVFTRSGGSFTQQQKLVASDPTEHAFFGVSLALSGDGNVVLIGAFGADHAGLKHSGAAYVFTRSGGTFTQQQKLVASDRMADAEFGWSVGLSTDGTTAIVGAPHHSDSGMWNGAAYVFTSTSGTFGASGKLRVGDNEANDNLGMSVALSADGSTAIVGADSESSEMVSDNGAAYVFTRSGGSFSFEQKLLARDKGNYDHFGYLVSLSADGNIALIGAYTESDGGMSASGAAYAFMRIGGTYQEQHKLLVEGKASEDHFGMAVALSADGNTAIVGARGRDDSGINNGGAAYVYGVTTKAPGAPCAGGAECSTGQCTDGVCCDTACGGGSDLDCQACSKQKGATTDGTCTLLGSAKLCRAAQGACDLPESCDGQQAACPADRLAPAAQICRPATEECDVPGVCDGTSPSCPAATAASACSTGTVTGCGCQLGRASPLDADPARSAIAVTLLGAGLALLTMSRRRRNRTPFST